MSTRIPRWLVPAVRKRPQLAGLGRELAEMDVHTVCQSARCPNLGECFARRTATFMIMGDVCTRNCGFCAVEHGQPALLDPGEPARVAQAAAMLALSHIVVTSVTRDDLPDGGASHFAATVGALRERLPEAAVEVLTPDFRGDPHALRAVLDSQPGVFNHNVETVPRLYPQVRPQADYHRSLALLSQAAETQPGLITKSGFMVGLGESGEEVAALLRDLRAANVTAVTIGQYLQPTRRHLPVAEFVEPDVFRQYGEMAREIGFPHVFSGPLVRSSYHAADLVGQESCNSNGVYCA